MSSYGILLPQILMCLTVLFVLIMKIIVNDRRQILYLAIFGVLISFFSSFNLPYTMNPPGIQVDFFGLTITRLIQLALLGVLAYSAVYLKESNLPYTEWSVLLIVSGIGLSLMANTEHLLILFIGLEISSLGFYILCGYRRNESQSLESALKYFVLGSVASAVLLLGIALVFAGEGTLELTKINLPNDNGMFMGTWISFFVVIIGLLFKLSLIPFHVWVPDVYEGAPTPITAFMSVSVKIATLGAIIRILTSLYPYGAGTLISPVEIPWQSIFWTLSFLTILGGNLLALVQSSVKRMLAYSSIAHAGYMALGLTAFDIIGFSAIIFYLAIYLVMNIVAFGIVALVTRSDESCYYEDLQGLHRREPVLAFCLAVCMISLAGLPPTAGFMGKLMLILGVLNAGYPGLAVIAVLGALISVAYYFKVIVHSYMKTDEADTSAVPEILSTKLGRATSVAGVIYLLGVGVYPGALYEVVTYAVKTLGG